MRQVINPKEDPRQSEHLQKEHLLGGAVEVTDGYITIIVGLISQLTSPFRISKCQLVAMA